MSENVNLIKDTSKFFVTKKFQKMRYVFRLWGENTYAPYPSEKLHRGKLTE